MQSPTAQQKEAIEQAATVIANDNVELACAFIQKTAVEKALPDMDKRLSNEYELRKHARADGRRYCDPVVLTYQAERMPEQIRLKVGGVTHQQIAVYEEFARNIPGFLPTGHEAPATVAAAAAVAAAAQAAAAVAAGNVPAYTLRQMSVSAWDKPILHALYGCDSASVHYALRVAL